MIYPSENEKLVILPNPVAGLRANPGQFFLAVAPSSDPYLPQSIFPFRIHGDLVESFLVSKDVSSWAGQRRTKIRGPFGHGFQVPIREHHALVLAVGDWAGAALVSLIDALVARECEVALFCKDPKFQEKWLPPEVEFHTIEESASLEPQIWAWADALYASGDSDFSGELAETRNEEILRKGLGWAQFLSTDIEMPCGVGVCWLCATRTRKGIVRNCRDGPVRDLYNLTGKR